MRACARRGQAGTAGLWKGVMPLPLGGADATDGAERVRALLREAVEPYLDDALATEGTWACSRGGGTSPADDVPDDPGPPHAHTTPQQSGESVC